MWSSDYYGSPLPFNVSFQACDIWLFACSLIASNNERVVLPGGRHDSQQEWLSWHVLLMNGNLRGGGGGGGVIVYARNLMLVQASLHIHSIYNRPSVLQHLVVPLITWSLTYLCTVSKRSIHLLPLFSGLRRLWCVCKWRRWDRCWRFGSKDITDPGLPLLITWGNWLSLQCEVRVNSSFSCW